MIGPLRNVVVAELGIGKTHDFSMLEGETEAALNAIRSSI